MKQCYKCQIEKEENQFTPSQLNNNNSKCKSCVSLENKQWAANNPDKVVAKNKKWRENNPEKATENSRNQYHNNRAAAIAKTKQWQQDNPERTAENRRKWKENNPDKVAETQRKSNKKWRENNVEIIREKRKNKREERNANLKERYKNDPVYRNRVLASGKVNEMLKSQGSSKKGKSSLDYFPWTPEELWTYLLKCMQEPGNEWMNENNQGIYDPKTWDDTDPMTWKWQLDHIIPHSDLPYDSMDHPNFKKAWDLSNLRPLSAKQNHEDGVRRTRHSKKDED
jgi:hypothetical protein